MHDSSSTAAHLSRYHFGLRQSEQGEVIGIGDGIAWIKGLPSAMMDEVLEFADGSQAQVFLLGDQRLGAILLHQTTQLMAGVIVRRTGKRLKIATSDSLLGRVVDPLGRPLDGGQPIHSHHYRLLDAGSPPITDRQHVTAPLYTGNKIIDTQIPIGRGQRQLIIGDDGLGKSALAIDTIIQQAREKTCCVYVALGQTRSSVATVIETLRQHGALEHTVVVVAEANALPGLRYLAPFAGCAIAESWMMRGKDTLIVYDDLTQHANTYRELSLLLHRPPGREAYPGDIFYLHSRLLERSTVLSPNLGGGSMTALPIVETKGGEIASYIPTNLISITDGQIYFDQRLFSAGMLPAIDVTRSVSRIGGKAQHELIKKESGRIRLDYLQFLELEVFLRFGTKPEKAMQEKIRRGQLLREILKQNRLSPVSAKAHLAWLLAYNEHMLDTLPLQAVATTLQQLFHWVDSSDLELGQTRDSWVKRLVPQINSLVTEILRRETP